MGYRTKYDIAMYPHKSDEDELEILREIIAKIEGVDVSKISPGRVEWYFDDSMKWYDHYDDMIEISKKFPDITFVLEGEGEEAGDLWVKYFNNGEGEECYAEIVYPQPKNPKFQYMM